MLDSTARRARVDGARHGAGEGDPAAHRSRIGRSSTPMQKGLIDAAYVVIPLAVAFGAWQLATSVAPSSFFPPPTKIFTRLAELLVGSGALADAFRYDLGQTLWRILVGLALGVAWGIVVGILIGRNRLVRETVNPIVEFLRSIPAATTLPLFLILLGSGDDMRALFIAYGVSWFVIINTAAGVASIDKTMLDMGVVFRISATRRLFRIVLPAALPQIFAGIRIASTAALLIGMLAELYLAFNGLGSQISGFKSRFDLTGMWVVSVVIAVLGLLINSLLEIVEGRVLAWHRRSKARS